MIFLTCKDEKIILKWYIVKLFLWKLRRRSGLKHTTKQMEILSDIRTLLHKKEEHLKRQNEKFLRETGVSSMSLSELHVIECIGKKWFDECNGNYDRNGHDEGSNL